MGNRTRQNNNENDKWTMNRHLEASDRGEKKSQNASRTDPRYRERRSANPEVVRAVVSAATVIKTQVVSPSRLLKVGTSPLSNQG
jgi:hypothetical protein